MVDRDRLDDFRARFNLGADADAFRRFRTRVLTAAHTALDLLPEHDRKPFEERFAFRNGSRYQPATSWGAGGHSKYGIIEELEDAESYQQLIERLQHFLWTFEHLGYFDARTRYGDRDHAGRIFAIDLKEAIELSPGIDLRLQLGQGGAELVPAGVALLDESVDHSLRWLSKYPDVQKEFRQALAILSEKRQEQYRQAQDSLRFALEKLLKLLLSNSASIEDQGKPLKEWLTARSVHENLRDVAVQIMMLLAKQYQNAAVKHDNAVASGIAKSWRGFEVEFVIYQYATLFRLLIEVANMDDSVVANHNSTGTPSAKGK